MSRTPAEQLLDHRGGICDHRVDGLPVGPEAVEFLVGAREVAVRERLQGGRGVGQLVGVQVGYRLEGRPRDARLLEGDDGPDGRQSAAVGGVVLVEGREHVLARALVEAGPRLDGGLDGVESVLDGRPVGQRRQRPQPARRVVVDRERGGRVDELLVH